jgi:hypothetical protein
MRKFSFLILIFLIYFFQTSLVLKAETNDDFQVESIDYSIVFPEKISFFFNHFLGFFPKCTKKPKKKKCY